jgi:hypothetical protein
MSIGYVQSFLNSTDSKTLEIDNILNCGTVTLANSTACASSLMVYADPLEKEGKYKEITAESWLQSSKS